MRAGVRMLLVSHVDVRTETQLGVVSFPAAKPTCLGVTLAPDVLTSLCLPVVREVGLGASSWLTGEIVPSLRL